MSAFYNEVDPFAAAWLRELIAQGHIAPGVVDERSIEDVRPDELAGFTQCHFFAGIGGWSLAARLAGIPDDYPLWTGSCPCQPFSAAGKEIGFADERHLWPAFFHLIEQCRPELVAGEQVAGGSVGPWFDLVQADLEGMGYAFGLCPSPSAGFGAPHIRDRAYWVADANGGNASAERQQCGGEQRFQPGSRGALGLADADDARLEGRTGMSECASQLATGSAGLDSDGPASLNGFWRDADWLGCTDGKWRPVESFFQSLVNGVSRGLGRVCNDHLASLEKEILTYADATNRDAAKDLRRLWESLPSAPSGEWENGGFYGIPQKDVLFAFLCQLALQGWPFAQGIPCSGPETSWRELRMLWEQQKAAGPPCQRGLGEQQPLKLADALHLLPPILARHAQAAWGQALQSNAEFRSPLIVKGSPLAANRVGRLRGYGNAINAHQAAHFLEAVVGHLASTPSPAMRAGGAR